MALDEATLSVAPKVTSTTQPIGAHRGFGPLGARLDFGLRGDWELAPELPVFARGSEAFLAEPQE